MIFISYRRADSESVVGRIYSELTKHFPTQDVFLDHDSIPLGKPFLDVIRERLATSKFALVLIGPQWCSIKDEKTGQRRLDDPNDFVRLEVETALATPGVDVIPLWVMRATTTSEDTAGLPASLQPLFMKNGMSIRPLPDEDNDLLRLTSRLLQRRLEVLQSASFAIPWSLITTVAGIRQQGHGLFIIRRAFDLLCIRMPDYPTIDSILSNQDSGTSMKQWMTHTGLEIGRRHPSCLVYFEAGYELCVDIMQNNMNQNLSILGNIQFPAEIVSLKASLEERLAKVTDYFIRIVEESY